MRGVTRNKNRSHASVTPGKEVWTHRNWSVAHADAVKSVCACASNNRPDVVALRCEAKTSPFAMVATYNANAVTHTAASAASALPRRSNTYTSAVPVSAVPTMAFPPLNTTMSVEGTSTHATLALYRHAPGRYLCRSAADTGFGELPSSRGDPSPPYASIALGDRTSTPRSLTTAPADDIAQVALCARLERRVCETDRGRSGASMKRFRTQGQKMKKFVDKSNNDHDLKSPRELAVRRRARPFPPAPSSAVGGFRVCAHAATLSGPCAAPRPSPWTPRWAR